MTVRDAESVVSGFVLLIEGLDWAFFTREDMVLNTTGIAKSNNHVGLRPPSFEFGINLKTCRFETNTSTFTIDDVSSDLADLFKVSVDADPLTETLEPGVNATTIERKHVGVEYVGTSGVRGQHSGYPGFTGVGRYHPEEDNSDAMGRPKVPVSDEPMIFGGRRMYCFRFLRRHHETAWGDLTDAECVWWGTMNDAGSVKGRTWTIEADGPESFLRRQLNANSFTEPRAISTSIQLADEEGYFSVAMYGTSSGLPKAPGQHIRWGEGVYDNTTSPRVDRYGTGSTTLTSTTRSDLINDMNTVISAAVAATGDNGEFDDPNEVGGACFLDSKGRCTIRIQDDSVDVGLGKVQVGVAVMVAHEKVWRELGYTVTGPESQGLRNWENDPLWLDLDTSASNDFNGPLPSTGYVAIYFTTRGIGTFGKGGYSFTWKPEYVRPVTVYPDPQAIGGHVVRMVLADQDPVVVPQYDHAPAKDPQGSSTDPYTITGAGDVNAQRLWAFIGPRRIEGTEEEIEELVQVGRCSWVDADGVVQTDGTGPALVLTEWYDPVRFGLEKGKIASGAEWRATDAQPIKVVPMAHWGRTVQGAASNVADVIMSIMLTTGTGTGWWTTSSHTTRVYGSNGFIAPGTNNPGSAFSLGTTVLDADRADFGLAIPQGLVAPRYVWEQLVGSLEVPEMAAVRVAHIGPVNADDLLAGLMRPLGWCWSLDGGQYGMFCPWDQLTPSDATLTLNADDFADRTPNQDIRHRLPLDRVKIRERLNPYTGDFRRELDLKATDRGARYRSGDSTIDVDAPYHEGIGWHRRWDRGFEWWSRRHFAVRGLNLTRLKGQDCWPGTVVRITDPWLVSQTGAYGVTSAVGVVTRASRDYENDRYQVDLIVQEPPAGGYRILAPEAMAYEWDESSKVLTCFKDFRGIGGGHRDVAPFKQPDWSTSAAQGADIKALQYIRGHLYQTLTNTIDSIDIEAGKLTMTGSWSGGTYYRDMETIVLLREAANQSAAWCHEVFSVIGDKSGQSGGEAVPRFNDA